jgi:tRNA dimethylallyltransferase
MEPRTDHAPLVVILGVTGSGKSALGLELSRLFDGAIIAADSRTVYRGMDIATAKPISADRRMTPHYLIDVVNPDESFTVADFKLLAESAIRDALSGGKVPFLVGGTGLYIDALLYDFTLRSSVVDRELRAQLLEMSVDQLRARVVKNGLEFPRDDQNPMRLIRVIESNGAEPQKSKLRRDTLVLGLSVDREILRQRITQRVEAMVEAGLADELRQLAGKYGWDVAALQTPGCKAFRKLLEDGSTTIEDAKATFVRNDMNLAKRQQTWFKRNKDVHWISTKEEAVDLVTTFLNKY